jgi:hypothetical protein
MVKKFAVIMLSAVLLSASPLAGLDFGGKINSTTKYQGNDFSALKWYESSAVHLWISSLFNKRMKLKFSADCSYEFRYDEQDGSYKNIIDLNLLKISGTLEAGRYNTIQLAAGRFSVSDMTGIVFSQASDGVYIKFVTPSIEFSIYGGSTGLLNVHDCTILTPPGTAYNPDYNAVYVTAPSYIPFGISLTCPSLFLNQTLAVEGWGFMDFSTDKYSRWYGTIAVSGPLSGKVFYSLMTTAGSESFKTLSDLSKAVLTFYPASGASVGLTGVYASGNNSFLSAFRGFTSQSADFALDEPQYTGLIKASVSGSYTILSCICLVAEGGFVFVCPENTVSYDGWQWNFSVVWNIFHDLQLSAGTSQYYAADTSRNKTRLVVTGAFVF